MLSIDEAIARERQQAKEQRSYIGTWDKEYSKKCEVCAEEHEQLAEWLEELKELQNITVGHLYAVAFNRGYLKAECIVSKEVRNKAIDDFVEIFKSKTSMENMLVDEIAEQLKAGGKNEQSKYKKVWK